MEKLDLRQQYKWLYNPSAKKVEFVDVPPLLFAMADGAVPAGTGPSDSADFKEAVAALYGLSYTLKFMVKKRALDPIDYPVMYLEGLWVTESRTYDTAAREAMTFTVMIMQPDFITADLFEEARAALLRKKPGPGPARVRLEHYHEGPAIQTLHIGPYATEPETAVRLEAWAAEHGYAQRGHHEIYLGDPFRAAPEKLRTILRHPVVESSKQ